MRAWLLVGWLLIPAFAAAWHFGPGQERLVLDDAGAAAAAGDVAAATEKWDDAEQAYSTAIDLLQGNPHAQVRLRLERAKAWMMNGNLHQAHEDLPKLLEELEADASTDKALLREVRSADASAKYYATWLLRLEGEGPEVWEPEIDAARQTYKLLASEKTSGAEQAKKDLEAAIRLARMDLSELQGLALPSQCKCCGCCKGKCRGKKNGKPQQTQKTDTRSAGGAMELPSGGH